MVLSQEGAVQLAFSRPARLRRTLQRPQFWFGLVVLVPLIAWYAIFHWGPVLGTLFMATHAFRVGDPLASAFVGLDNFQDLFAEPEFYIAFGNSITYALIYFAGMLPLALLVAALLNEVSRGRQGYLFCIFLPVVMNLVAVSVLWIWIYDYAVGPLNYLLTTLGLPRSKFLTGYESVLPSIAGVMIWKGLGFNVVILLAGMLNIPEHFYDAARVDGANAWHRFRHVTLPLLGHTLALVSILTVMSGLQMFVPVDVMTAGGPGRASLVVNLMIYQQGILNVRMSFASAMALILFAVVFCVTFIQLRILKPTWSY